MSLNFLNFGVGTKTEQQRSAVMVIDNFYLLANAPWDCRTSSRSIPEVFQLSDESLFFIIDIQPLLRTRKTPNEKWISLFGRSH